MQIFGASSTIRLFGSALLAGVLVGGAAANTAGTAEALVKSTTEKVLDVLNQEREVINNNPARIYGIVDQYILPNFDFERMSQRVLGKFWHRATPEQQQKFVLEFQTLLVHTYAAALREYTAQKVEYLPSRSREGGEISVRTQIVQSGGPPIPIHYEMYKLTDGWKVYDITIDGVSLVINYRSTFASEIRNSGIDGLIERLVKHNEERRR